jgi:hypothetical protein
MGMVHLANRIQAVPRISAWATSCASRCDTGELQAHEKGQVVAACACISARRRTGVGQHHGPAAHGRAQPAGGKPYVSALVDESPLSHIGRRYGLVSGDINPIHLSALTAKMLGFRKAIAHGMWTKARALATLMPREPVEQAEAMVEFKTPLFLPARASLWAAREEGNALFEVRNAKGDKPHLRGRVTF